MVMANFLSFLLAFVFLGLSLCHEGHDEPAHEKSRGYIQYCRSFSGDSIERDPGFCVATTHYQNASTSQSDLLVTIHVRRRENPPQGWIAVGLGSVMNGALMVVIYGDPASSKAPTVSMRTTKDHAAPHLLAPAETGDVSFDVHHASWTTYEHDTDLHTAEVELGMRKSTLWPGTTISVAANAQPWIWASNAEQKFDDFKDDADLEFHGKGDSRFGGFYADMKSAASDAGAAPPFPSINPSERMIGAAEDAASLGGEEHTSDFSWRLHGSLMGATFLVFMPAAVVALRSSTPRSFQLHWSLQLVAGLCFASGMALALYLHSDIIHVHQWVGLVLGGLLAGQAVLGWRHHMTFLSTKRRTWFSTAHIWLGRVILPVGALNLILGMLLRNVMALWVIAAAVLIAMEAAALIIYVRRASARQARAAASATSDDIAFAPLNEEEDEAFVLDEESDAEEDPWLKDRR